MKRVERISSVADFQRHIDDIRHGRRDSYPFYLALLYTTEPGIDADLHRWIAAHWEELDLMTLRGGLVFAFPEFASHAPMYEVARELGVAPDQMPCGVVFADPERTEDQLIVPWSRLLPSGYTDTDVTAAFRLIASAFGRCASEPLDERLRCFQGSLDASHRAEPSRSASTASGEALLQRAVSGASIISALAAIVALL